MLDACLLHGTNCCSLEMGTPIASSFSQALSSRCVSGIVVHIESPDVNTRLAIVNHLASRRGLRLDPLPPTWWWNGPGRFANSKALTRLDAMARLEGTGGAIGLQLIPERSEPPPRPDRFDRPMLSTRYARP